MGWVKISMVAVLLCLPLVQTGTADDERKLIDTKSADREPTTDQEFLIRAIACEVANVKMAENAEKNGTREEVRRLAQTLVEEHKKIRDDFLEQAKTFKLAVVEGLEKSHREQVNRLSKLEGAAFDREFVQVQNDWHDKGIKLYKKWAKEAKSAELRETTERALRKLQDHQAHISKVKNQIKE